MSTIAFLGGLILLSLFIAIIVGMGLCAVCIPEADRLTRESEL